MGDSRDRTGSRFGPYQLDKRYEDLDEPGGQLYAAHHVETGRPALVLIPDEGGAWAPRGDWSARFTSQTSPPCLVMELERPLSNADALVDVDLALIQMAGGISCVEEREDANADFTQPPRPPTVERRPRGLPAWQHARTGALVAGALTLVAVLLWPRLLKGPGKTPDLTDDSLTESVSFIDSQESNPLSLSYPLPGEPFAGQMKPPCAGTEVAIRGGCWVQIKQDAPCPKSYAEYEGKCYVAVREKKPEPRSFKR